MNRNKSSIVISLGFSCFALLMQGCHANYSKHASLSFHPGQDVIVNYALDVETRKYSTGKFVSMDNHWITISKTTPEGSNDPREWHATLNLDRVYMIQSAQD